MGRNSEDYRPDNWRFWDPDEARWVGPGAPVSEDPTWIPDQPDTEAER